MEYIRKGINTIFVCYHVYLTMLYAVHLYYAALYSSTFPETLSYGRNNTYTKTYKIIVTCRLRICACVHGRIQPRCSICLKQWTRVGCVTTHCADLGLIVNQILYAALLWYLPELFYFLFLLNADVLFQERYEQPIGKVMTYNSSQVIRLCIKVKMKTRYNFILFCCVG